MIAISVRAMKENLPVPPYRLRAFVGPTDEAAFDNPTGRPIEPSLPNSAYDTVFDFGCGCGRLARQMLQQVPRPRRYVGIDLHREVVDWAAENLTRPGFEFHHHDVHNPGFNPGDDKADVLPLPSTDGEFSLLIAWSVFTHLRQHQAEHYLRECARILRPDGFMLTTWFLFEKRYFPMMQDFQSALYINDIDPTNAVIFDRDWLAEHLEANGLVVAEATPPSVRGFQWKLILRPRGSGSMPVALPRDAAAFGSRPPPVVS